MSDLRTALPAAQAIESRPPKVRGRLQESWQQRRLIWYFGRRFNQKRYLRTWLGKTWILLRPGLVVASQLFVFGGILRVSGEGVPYPLVFLLGFAVWHLFAECAYWTTRSLELSRSIIRRMYVPRGPIIIGALVPALIDFAIVATMFIIAVIAYAVFGAGSSVALTASSALVPVGIAILILIALGVGLVLSVPGMYFRDFRFGLRFVLNFWYFLTPVVYPLSRVPNGYRTVVDLNPVTAPVELIKRGLLDGQSGAIALTSYVSTVVVLILLLGIGTIVYFRGELAALDHV